MESIVREDFNQIKVILNRIDGSNVIVNKGFNNIYLYNDESNVYIKFNKKQVILSNITLGKQRQGYGTEILNVLIEYCKKYFINELIIESVLTEEMFNFCNKHGFIKIYNEFDTGFFGNYLLKVKGN